MVRVFKSSPHPFFIMKNTIQIIFFTICLIIALLLEQYTSIDINLQNMFFNFTSGEWFLTRQDNYLLHFFLYSGIKIVLVALSIIVFAVFAASFESAKLRPWRYACIMFLSAMLLVPVVLAGAKKYTNVFCPAQLEVYGGNKPYAKLFSHYPDSFTKVSTSRGRCFPAGHASGGFALMVLFFCFKKRYSKVLGLFVGLAAGWGMGLYQMLRGEHFLSHTIVTMFGAWVILLLLSTLMDKIKKKYFEFFR